MVDPKVYVLLNKPQRCPVSDLVEEFADELMIMSGKCMDIGCGPGDVTKEILMPALGPNVVMTGTDISIEMISYANKMYGDDVRLTFDTLDIQTKNLPEKYLAVFDHIFSFFTLQWCSDIRQALDNMYRMLRPGGSMIVLLVASNDIYDVFEFLAHDNRYAPYLPNPEKLIPPLQRSIYPRKELKDLLTNIGFKIHHCSLRNMVDKHENLSIFSSSLKSVTPFVKGMPNERAIQFWKDFEYEFMKRKTCYEEIRNDGKKMVIFDFFPVFIIHATK